MELKDGDIFRWSWNEREYDKKELKRQAGTLYWCCARIAIWHEDRNQLVDIWDSVSGSGEYVKRFNREQIEDQLDVTFVANIHDLKPIDHSSKFNDYDNEDCVNIRHPNAWRGTCMYVKKDAKESISKKRRALKVMIDQEFYKAKSAEDSIERLNCMLENLTSDTYIPSEADMYIPEDEKDINF